MVVLIAASKVEDPRHDHQHQLPPPPHPQIPACPPPSSSPPSHPHHSQCILASAKTSLLSSKKRWILARLGCMTRRRGSGRYRPTISCLSRSTNRSCCPLQQGSSLTIELPSCITLVWHLRTYVFPMIFCFFIITRPHSEPFHKKIPNPPLLP